MSWDDPQTEDADLVILRATWDYAERREEFLAWTARVRNLLNAPQVVAWNSDKRYLDDLAAAGVPTLRSYFFAPGEKVRLPKGELVVKRRSGGDRSTPPFHRPLRRRDHAAALQDSGRTALCSLRRAGGSRRTALVFLGGDSRTPSPRGRCCARGRVARPRRLGNLREEKLTPADPDFEMWDVGHAALEAATRHLGLTAADLLYARVDLIGGADDPLVLELELIEPSLGWRQTRRAGPAVAAADVRAVRGVSSRASWARPAVASTPIARRSPRCRPPAPATWKPPARRAHR